jgi:hypothetical protein
MPIKTTRKQLYALVWEKPMTAAARDLNITDTGLRKVCLKHAIPTPRAGHWMKVAHGKNVKVAPLPDPDQDHQILIFGNSGAADTDAMASARDDVLQALEAAGEGEGPPNPIVEKTLARLRKARRNAEGLVVSNGSALVHVAVHPDRVERAGALLAKLVAAGEAAGLTLVKSGSGTAWLCNGETIAFELVEAADQVEHVATAKELAPVEKWKRERDEYHKRYGYWRDWGEPKIPKWERRYQGRLQVRLEDVRLKTERAWWGEPIRRVFSETRKRTLEPAIPKIIATVAALAAAKRSNGEFEERQRIAAAEAARAREAAERRRLIDEKALAFVEQLAAERTDVEQLQSVIGCLAQPGLGPRASKLIQWAEQRLQALELQLDAEAIESRLEEARLFGDGEPGANCD